jgi:dihydrolipoamide dehydrogenase
MSGDRFDVVVIGGGPGGYATALRASGHGLRVAVVEAGLVGGTCLHRGCIPSKALLHVAALADAAPELVALGLADTQGAKLDVQAAGALRDRVVHQLHNGLVGLLDSRSIEVVAGRGRIAAPGVVDVEGPEGQRRLQAGDIVVATGSVPIDLPVAPRDGRNILCSDDALRLERVPTSAVVVGAGAVGVEFASLWRSLGAEVTILEAAADVVPNEDADVSKALRRAFTRRGMKVLVGTGLAGATVSDDGARVETTDGTIFEVDQVLVAVGRRPATAGVGLDELGLLGPRGEVLADERGATAVAGVWAVGDVLPTLALAHAAFAEGFVVADTIAGIPAEPVDHRLVPRVTYCSPEVASVGLTETEARALHGDSVEITTASLAGNARSIIEGVGGIVKLVHAADGTLLGGHIVGPSATELIAELGLAITWEALTGELAGIVHPHPSLSETVREAALAAAGAPFHLHT